MLVQGSTTTPSGLNVYGSGAVGAAAGQIASYVDVDGEIASAMVVDAGPMPAGAWIGPDRITLEAGASAPATGCVMQVRGSASLELPAAA